MVLAERNAEIVRNGRRSRGPSPNGHGSTTVGGSGTPETSSDDDNSIKRNGKSKSKQSEYEEKIRVGRDYQAVCPPLVPDNDRKPEILNDRALLVWSPTKEIPDTKLEEYISVAKEKYGYNGEQALGMLFWHKHDLERAVMDLANFTPFPDEWTVEDKVLFEQAFQFHGKSFHRIRQMLPDKSIASLVKYYYSWKKTRHRQSVMDRQEKAKASKEGSENGSENGSNEDSDNDDKDQALASSSGLQESNSKLGDPLCKHSKANDGVVSVSASTSASITMAAAGVDVDNSDCSATAVNPSSSNYALKRQQTSPNPTIGGNLSNSNVDSVATTATATTASIMTTSTIGGGGSGSGSGGGGGGGIGGRTTPTSGGIGIQTSSGIAAGFCENCGVACNNLNASAHGKLCSSCHHHWRRTGHKRPTSGPFFGKRSRDRNAERHKSRPPRGMCINHDDIVALANGTDNQDELIANIDRKIVSLLTQVQLNKQQISLLKRKNSDAIEDLRPPENMNRINSRWTNDELMLAVQGVRKFGKDFQSIAEVIGTKTEAHLRTFYVNYRRRYNLDQVLKEYEADKELSVPVAAAANVASDGLSRQKDETKSKDPSPSSTVEDFDNVITNETTSNNATTTTAIISTTTTSTTTSTTTTTNTSNTTTTTNANVNTNTNTNTNTTSTTTTIANASKQADETKSNNPLSKDNVIMQIDLDADQAESPPSNKKLAVGVSGQELPKSGVV